MRRRFDSVPPDLSIADFMHDHVMQSDQDAFPVVSGTRIVGIVSGREAMALPSERWLGTPVSAVMTPAAQVPTVAPDRAVEDAMRALYKDKGKYVRIRRIDKTIEECKRLKAEADVRVIYFADDVFGMDKKWLYEFLPIYQKEVSLEFICLVRADIVASDDEYAARLAAGGCRSVFFGIESGNEQLRNRVLTKNLRNDQIIRAAELLHRAGIKFRAYNIIGLPDETLQDALSTVELNITIKTDYPWCSVFAPFPGTALTDYAFERGYLGEEFEYNSLSQSFFLSSNLKLAHIREMQNLQKFFQTTVLWPWTFPLVKRLIRLPPNRLFTCWFGFVYFLVYIKSERRNWWKTLKFALQNFRHVLAKQ